MNIVQEAFESARSSGLNEQRILGARRLHSPERIHAIISTFIRDLPADMTVAELIRELEDIHYEL